MQICIPIVLYTYFQSACVDSINNIIYKRIDVYCTKNFNDHWHTRTLFLAFISHPLEMRTLMHSVLSMLVASVSGVSIDYRERERFKPDKSAQPYAHTCTCI